jgi:hypothetical protein
MMPILAALSWPTIGLRSGVVAGALVIWFWTQSLIGRRAEKAGLGDVVHDLTAGWHRYLSLNARAANAALIVSSLFIDVFGVVLIGAGIFGVSFAPALSLIVLFIMRQVAQGLCSLPPPPGVIWRPPGFPSLLVTYGVSNDLFFSGHTGLAVLGAIYAAHSAPLWLAVIAGIIALGEALVVLALRAHYTLDVIAGVFAAFLAADIAAALAPTLDAWLR